MTRYKGKCFFGKWYEIAIIGTMDAFLDNCVAYKKRSSQIDNKLLQPIHWRII